MAKRKTTQAPSRYFLVNPGGAIHEVTYAHAKTRLATVGWRMATADEVKAYQGQRTQVWNKPIGTPWNPEPEPVVEPEATTETE